jgi:hypothetical protein
MSRIRQLYLYGICAVSLLLLATGIENLIRLLIQTLAAAEATPWLWLNRGALRQQVSFFAALTIVNAPVWAGHWLAANRRLGVTERASPIRRFYLYLTLAGALLFFVPGAIGMLRIPLWAVLHAPVGQPALSALGVPIGLVVVTAPIWLYHRRQALGDAAVVGDDGGLGASRRLYLYLATFVLANFLLVNFSRLATSVWEGTERLVTGNLIGAWSWASAALPAYAAATAVCLAAWAWHWNRADSVAGDSGQLGNAERQSILRRLALFGLVLVCLCVAAANASTALNDLVRAALGASDPTRTGRPLVDALGQPIIWGLTYGVFWLYQRRLLQREASRAREVTEQAAVRQAYYYLVTLVGLSLFSVGLILLLSTLLSFPSITSDQLADDWFRDQISDAVTLVVVGAPIWLGHWHHQQHLAEQPATGRAERAAFWRRAFLYLVIFATVVAVVVDAASALYQLFLAALGDNSLPSLIEALRTPASVIAVASILLLYHWQVLRGDLRTAASVTPAGPALAAILLKGNSAEALEAALGRVTGLTDGSIEADVIHGPRLEQQVAERLRRWRS